jgi:hypothetical protein
LIDQKPFNELLFGAKNCRSSQNIVNEAGRIQGVIIGAQKNIAGGFGLVNFNFMLRLLHVLNNFKKNKSKTHN